jgi:hypothetical protein
MINTKGITKVITYLDEYHEYIQGRNIDNIAGDFFMCVMRGYTKPKSVNNIKVPQYMDFEQRPYQEEDFKKYYDNFNSLT